MWFIILFSLAVNAEQKMCDASVIKNACEKIKAQSDQEYFPLSNGDKWKNPFYDDSLKETKQEQHYANPV